jgi:DNA repair protein RadC
MGNRKHPPGPGEVSQLHLTFAPASSSQDTHQEDHPIITRKAASELRERLQLYGRETLSDGELLLLVLCTSAAKDSVFETVEALLKEHGGLSWLLRATYSDLSKMLGEIKAAQLWAVLELARRLTQPSTLERYQIISPDAAAKLVMAEMAWLDHEEIRVLVLDTKNNVLANIRLYRGTLNSTCLRAAEIFRPAITRNGAGIMVIHNHPSGDPSPSPEDQLVTNQLVEAGKLLDIDLIDHIIIGQNRYVSLKERMRW